MTNEDTIREAQKRIPYKSDPEAQYRAGFKVGAWGLLQQIEDRLLASDLKAIDVWLGKLDAWRVASRLAVSRGRTAPLKLPPELKL